MKWITLAVAVALVGTAGVSSAQVRQAKAGQSARSRPWQVPSEIPASLKRAMNAVGRIRYSGVRVVEAKNGANRQRHTEIVITDGDHSRIEFPPDSPQRGQVVVENSTERRHFLPGKNELHVLPPRREGVFIRLAEMAKRKLVFSEAAGNAIAGFPTQVVSIADRQGNVLHKLWIEPKSGMILKRELYDRAGTLVGFFEFIEANLRPNTHPTDFVLRPKGVRLVTPDLVLDRLLKRGGFRNVRLPSNATYRLEVARIQKIGGHEVLVQQYAGTGKRITLYQFAAGVNPQRLGRLERPDVQIHSWNADGMSFVLVGDITDAELRELARRAGG